jgi:type IV fimbrial biogenesis protein FimT
MGTMTQEGAPLSRPSGKRSVKGFELIEQIVTLAVLAVLAAIAVPAFARMLDRQELNVAQNDYIVALLHARYLAVNDQVRTVFCPSHDGRTCNSSDWTDGWLIGRDPSNKGQPDGGPLYVGGKYSRRIHVISSSKLSIRLQPDGTVGNSNQTLTICLRNDPSRALSVVIAKRGRVRGQVANAADAATCAGVD